MKRKQRIINLLSISVLKICPYAGNIKRTGFSFVSHDHLHPGNHIQHKAITDLYIRKELPIVICLSAMKKNTVVSSD